MAKTNLEFEKPLILTLQCFGSQPTNLSINQTMIDSANKQIFTGRVLTKQPCHQCDQIGRFIALFATIQSLWQQLICPNLLHSKAIFVKVSKSFIFLANSFLVNFYRHLAIFIWSHYLSL